jgi:pyrroline-5-carboxylate reductase
MRLGVVGAGKMGGALLRGFMRSGVAPEQCWATTKSSSSASAAARVFGIATATDVGGFAAHTDVVLLATKPAQLDGVVRALVDAGLRSDALVISVAAATTTAALEASFGRPQPVVRAMPNTPAFIGKGMTAIAAGAHVTAEHLAIATDLFEAVGRCVTVDERQMNAVTAISGSGPAYVYLIVEALADAGVRAGLPRATALALVTQTLLGATAMVDESGRHPAQLKDDVTTPGGCTIAGLMALEDGKLRATLARAVEAAKATLDGLS